MPKKDEDKEPKDIRERYLWLCNKCGKGGTAATREDAEQIAEIHALLHDDD